ncbi:hypothetical protein [Bdellovibrio sp. HCB337]|uniref:hypothetical protein n=1 Tax=Bdellovibrio sp. HCB337 TaxID=3394358 RepID=UPI0039A4FD9E
MSEILLSIVIPSTVKKEGAPLQETLSFLLSFEGVEIICVGHEDAPTRAERLQMGFEKAQGEMVLFHHPRSRISPEGIQFLLKNSQRRIWGGFTHRFDKDHWLLRFTSWYSNHVRSRTISVLYLDHCIFFHRDLYTDEIPPIPVFEDTLLCYNLRKHQRPMVAPYPSVTSAVRFEKNGIYRQALLNQLLKWGFYLGVPYDTMNKFYEKGLQLNSEYKK